jgi:hypothetical protein
MHGKRVAVALSLLLLSLGLPPMVGAAPLFYLSDLPLGAAQPGAFSLSDPVNGATRQLNIYAMTDVRLSGVSLDLVETGGGIEFSGLNVVNDGRWWVLDGPQIVEPSRITSIGGGALPGLIGNGIGAGDSVDSHYHPLATVDYKITDVTRPTSFELQVGQNAIAEWDGNIPMVHLGDPQSPAVPGTPPPPPPLPPKVDPPAPEIPPTLPDPSVTDPNNGHSVPHEWTPQYQQSLYGGEPVDPLLQTFYTYYWPDDYQPDRAWPAVADSDGRWTVRVFSAGDVVDGSLRVESSDVWGFAIPGGVAIDGLDLSAAGAEVNFQSAAMYEIAGGDTGAGMLIMAPANASIPESDSSEFRKIQESLVRNSRMTRSMPHFAAFDSTSSFGDSAPSEATLPTGPASAPEPSSLLLILFALTGVPLLIGWRTVVVSPCKTNFMCSSRTAR